MVKQIMRPDLVRNSYAHVSDLKKSRRHAPCVGRIISTDLLAEANN